MGCIHCCTFCRAICYACVQFNGVGLKSSAERVRSSSKRSCPVRRTISGRRFRSPAVLAHPTENGAHRICYVEAMTARSQFWCAFELWTILKRTQTDRNQLVPSSFSLFVARFPGVRPRNFNFNAHLARLFATRNWRAAAPESCTLPLVLVSNEINALPMRWLASHNAQILCVK